MRVEQLWLSDFRNHVETHLRPSPRLTVITGDNGQGKTNLLEAVSVCATLASMRAAPAEAMVRAGYDRAVVRAEVSDGRRRSLIELQLAIGGRMRAQLNRQPLRRSADLLGVLRTTVFAPDDLDLIKGGPAGRRRLLDDLLVACSPRVHELRRDLDRVLRQRATLLKQAGPRPGDAALVTLDVWDAKLAELGTDLGRRRRELVAELTPAVEAAHDRIVGSGAGAVCGAGPGSPGRGGARTCARPGLTYDPDWLTEGLAEALARVRRDELRRGVSLVGPHRDDLAVALGALPARTHASQGEQRSLALALRLAGHEVVRARTGTTPVVLLDDVLSELDPRRSTALLDHLPDAQVLLTTATPPGRPDDGDLVVEVRAGTPEVIAGQHAT